MGSAERCSFNLKQLFIQANRVEEENERKLTEELETEELIIVEEQKKKRLKIKPTGIKLPPGIEVKNGDDPKRVKVCKKNVQTNRIVLEQAFS